MKRIILTAVVLALGALPASAGPVRRVVKAVFGGHCQQQQAGGCGQPQSDPAVQSQPQPAPTQAVQYTPAVGGSGLIQAKADVQAYAGWMFHPGGGMVPGANYEGVGYSSASPQDALNHCCNNGGTVVAQAVSAGPGGWYAVRQYGAGGEVVRATSYDGLNVPVDSAPYTPIQLGSPLPTTPRQFAPAVQLFSPPLVGGCVGGRCPR